MKFLTFLWEKIKNVLKDSFLLSFGIAFFNFIPYGINKYFSKTYLDLLFFINSLKFFIYFIIFLVIILGISFILSFLNKKVKNCILKSLFFISLIFFIVEIFLMINFKSLINPSIIQILLETNKSEAIEFLEMYINLKNGVIIIAILIICFLARKIKIELNIFEYKLFRYFCIFMISIFMICLPIKMVGSNSNVSIFETVRQNCQKIADIFSVTRFYKSIKICRQNIKEYNEIFLKLEKNKVKITSNNSKIKNIIFVIGESTTRNHMSLYGYKLKTNPLLEKLEKERNLYKFTDTISPHAHTIPVIKKLLTFYNYESKDEWYTYNNIIDIMKIADYKTYWFSNQESSGIYGNVAVALGKKSSTIIFNKIKDSSQEFVNLYDEQIVNKSLKHIDKNFDKNFIIYHLMGTHGGYKNRYPQEFEIFKNKKNIISDYDNAVLYNDYIIDKIISNFKDKEAILIYVSDHGEEVYDFRNFVGHAEGNGSRYMIEVPFLIYVSDKFKENYPEIVKKIENSVDRPYMTDDLIHAILDIAEIKTSEYEESRSIINDKFNFSRKRIFSGQEYETYWKNKN